MARDYEPVPEIRGNPNRKTRAGASAAKATSSATSAAVATRKPRRVSEGSQKQQKRVQVTPADWGELDRVAAELGLPYSQVYNVAFKALLRERSRR